MARRYDLEYLKHFTKLHQTHQDPLLLPSYCNYVNASYNPHRPEVLIGTYVLPKGPLYNEMITALRSWNDRTRSSLELKKIGELYKYYDYRDLAAHPAMVLLPYMTATISFCEFYRMNIPLFFPSLDLIVQWEIEHKLLSARLYWPDVPEPEDPPNPFSPNKQDAESAKYWLKHAQWLTYKHIIYFDDWDDLFLKLYTTDLVEASAKMEQHNQERASSITRSWEMIFDRVKAAMPTDGSERAVPSNFDDAMHSLYGLKVGDDTDTQQCFQYLYEGGKLRDVGW